MRQRLVKDALGYLDGLSHDSDDPGLEREIVEAYVKVANVQGNTYDSNLGDTAGAMDSARKAVAHGERLYGRYPNNDNAFALGTAYQAMAEMIHESSQPATPKILRPGWIPDGESCWCSTGRSDSTVEQIVVLQHWGDFLARKASRTSVARGESLVRYNKALNLSDQLMQAYPGNRLFWQSQFDSQPTRPPSSDHWDMHPLPRLVIGAL